MKTAKTPKEARAKPGLKLLTPLEKAAVERIAKADRARWSELFRRNRNKSLAEGKGIQLETPKSS